MRQKKSFFVKNNSLNKGNQLTDNKLVEKNIHFAAPKLEILAEYEAANPGISQKILEMAKSEQEHEHSIEKLKISMASRAQRMGRICGLFVILAICYFTSDMLFFGHTIYALLFSGFSFAALLMLSCKHKCRCVNCSNSCSKDKNSANYRNNGRNYYGNRNNNRNHSNNEAKITAPEESISDKDNSFDNEKKHRNNRNHSTTHSNRYRGKH